MVAPARRLVRTVLAACAALAITASAADASHFYGGTVYWERDLSFQSPTHGRYIVTFDAAFRWGGAPFDWTPARPQVGQTLLSPAEFYTVNGALFDRSGTLAFVVTSVDAAKNLMTARHTFSIDIPFAAGPTVVTWQNSARSETALEGNGNQPYRLRTIVDPTKGTRSPRVTLPPRFAIPVNMAFSGRILSEAYDGFFNQVGFAPLDDSLLQRQIPCGTPSCAQPLQLSAAGFVSWTPMVPGQYAVQFKVTSFDSFGNARLSTPVDLIIDVVTMPAGSPQVLITPPVPPSGGELTVHINEPLSFTATLSPFVSGYLVTPITHTELPAGVAKATSDQGFFSTLTLTSPTPRTFPICVQAVATRPSSPEFQSFGLNCYTVRVIATPPTLTCGPPLTLNTTHVIDASGVRYAAAPTTTTIVHAVETGPLDVLWALMGPLFFAEGQLRTQHTYPPLNISAPLPNQPVTLSNFAQLRKGEYVLSTAAAHGGVPPFGLCSTIITVIGDAQEIAFPPVGPLFAGGPAVPLIATAPGGPVSFMVVSGPGTITSGNLLQPLGAGVIEVRATQAGNDTFASASANQFITVNKAQTSLSVPLVAGDRLVGSTISVATTLSRSSAPSGVVPGAQVVFTLTAAPSNPDGGGSMTASATTDAAGNATVSFALNARGVFTLTAAFAASGTLDAASSAATSISVFQRTRVTAADATGVAGAQTALDATLLAFPQLTAIAGQNVTFNTPIVPSAIGVTAASGQATVHRTFPAGGTFPITASFLNPADFFADEAGAQLPATAAATVVIARAVTNLTTPLLPDRGFTGAPLSVAASLTRVSPPSGPVAAAPVRFALTGPAPAVEQTDDTDAAGAAVATFSPFERGQHTIVATFSGDDGLAGAASATATLQVYQRVRLSLTVPASGVAGAVQSISATLTSLTDGQPIAHQAIRFSFGSGVPPQVITTDQAGVAPISVAFPSAGPRQVTASFANVADHFANAAGDLADETVSANTSIAAATTSLAAPVAVATAQVGDTITVTTTLLRVDAPAGPLAGASVALRTIDPNGVAADHPLTSGVDGSVAASVQTSLRGVYSLSFSFAGSDAAAAASSSTHQLTVLQPTVLMLATSGQTAGAPATITATLGTPGGAPVAGQAVTITLEGQAHTFTTGADGAASFVTTIARAGSYAVSASFANTAAFFVDAASAATLTLADPTAPQVTPAVTGTLGAGGWYTSNVEVTWLVVDPESDVTSCASTTITNDGANIAVTCQATSGGGSTTATVTIKRDTAPPQLALPPNQSASAPTAAGIAVSYPAPTATDPSGIASVSCAPSSGSIFPAGTNLVTCTAADPHGHVSTGTFTITVAVVVVEDDLPGLMLGAGRAPAPDQHTIEFEFSVVETRRGEGGQVSIVVRDGRRRRGDDERFRARSADEVAFSNAPEYDPGRRQNMRVDTVIFSGTGKWQGRNGYSYVVRTSDRGEWGRGRDTFTIEIRAGNGTLVFSGGGVLTSGNIQSIRVPVRSRR